MHSSARKLLMLPGPTMVPGEVLSAVSREPLNHRGTRFSRLYADVTARLARIINTSGEVHLLPASGTGAMEAAVCNLFSPGDDVVVLLAGEFGERFGEICRAYGLRVAELRSAAPGRAVSPAALAGHLAGDRARRIRGILVTHCETSTGVLSDIRGLAAARGAHPALIVADCVSSLGAVEINMDGWGIDAVVSASQKALMCPPGLGILALGPRGVEASTRAALPRFYWDVRWYRELAANGQTPYTPALPQLFGLQRALGLMEEEGLDAIYRRHRALARMFRRGLEGLGLKPLAGESEASTTVTAALLPECVNPTALRRSLEEMGVSVAGGQGPLKDRVLRFGHMGFCGPLDVVAALAALEMCLDGRWEGAKLGSGVAAAQRAWVDGEVFSCESARN